MSAWFDNEREDIDFESIHLEYVDLSGIGKTHQLELEARVQWINNRIERVKMLVYSARMTVNELPPELIAKFTLFKQYIESLRLLGHKIYFDGDTKLFEELLKRIESKEKKYLLQLEEAQRELDLFVEHQNKGQAVTSIQSRQSFISNINVIRKSGYPVIQNETTVEEFALMIKAHNEEIERQNKKK